MTHPPDAHGGPDDLDALAEAAAESASGQVATRHKCPACGGTAAKTGLCTALPAGRHVFVPTGAGITANLGYSVKAAVCLDCGHLRHCLTSEDVAKLRGK